MGYRTIKLKRTGLKISTGNTGMGNVYNVSKDQSTCGELSKHCKPYCYLGSAYYRSMKGVVACHKANTAILSNLSDDKTFHMLKDDMDDFMSRYQPKMFRVSVNGDIADMLELMFWNYIALSYPDCNILIFTKRLSIMERAEKFDFRSKIKAKNLHIKISVFFNFTEREIQRAKKLGYPIAYTDTNNLYNYKTCKKPCETCKWCFTQDKDVFLPLHGGHALKKKREWEEKIRISVQNRLDPAFPSVEI